MTTIPTIASPEDIDPTFAARAFTNTSFTPENRGDQRRNEYAEAVNGLYAELLPLAKTEEQKQMLADHMESYRDGYRKRLNAYLASHANVASAFIVGPARFPTARMQKRSQWADNKANELHSWSLKAKAAIKRDILEARPQEEKEAADWRALNRDLAGSLAVVIEIDAGRKPYTRSAFTNSIAGKIERLAQGGDIAQVEKALAWLAEHNMDSGKPVFTSRHKVWSFAVLARERVAKVEAAALQGPEVIATGEGVKVVANPEADRVQIVFDAKPAAEVIAKLKSEAWKWSPNAVAWQRKLTEAAKFSAMQITGLT